MFQVKISSMTLCAILRAIQITSWLGLYSGIGWRQSRIKVQKSWATLDGNMSKYLSGTNLIKFG